MIRLLLTHLHALIMVVSTALHLRRLEGEEDFDELVARLRHGPEFPVWARDPRPYVRLTGRLLRWLPPKGMGPCMKRSLILLHLWTRCGLEPELHLGVRRGTEKPFEAHAWLTTSLPNGGQIATADSGYEASFSFLPETPNPPGYPDPPA